MTSMSNMLKSKVPTKSDHQRDQKAVPGWNLAYQTNRDTLAEHSSHTVR